MDHAPGSMHRLAGTLAYAMKTRVAAIPALALPLGRIRGHGEVLGPDTDVVIESFPRCASSFAVAAFRLAQEPRRMRIANHTHMPAQVIEAGRRGVPALVLIRDPEATVLSHVIHTPTLSIESSLKGYLRFHEPLRRVRDGFVVGTFDEVTTDLGRVIRRLNERFGTGFAEFEHTPANLERLDREIETDYRSRARSEDELERTIPRPSVARERLKARLRDEFAATPVRLRAGARAAYEELLPRD